MILPFLRGILPPYITPATWFLVLMNCVIFFANLPVYVSTQKSMDKLFRDTEFMQTQGSVFAQTVERAPSSHSPLMRELARKAVGGDKDSRLIIGGLSIRNHEFMKSALDQKFDGDEVAIEKWHDEFYRLQRVQKLHPTFQWGLSAQRSGFVNWITYQFAHSGFEHLFLNMIFLLLFATFLEATIGSSLVMLLYLGSGVAGAAFFIATAGLSHSPLIGASGSVSGMMACVAVYFWKQPVRFFYWLLPVQGYYGFRDLPAWLILIVALIPDFAGQMSSVSDLSGLAYGAHLGGAAFGACFALALKNSWLVADPPPAEELA